MKRANEEKPFSDELIDKLLQERSKPEDLQDLLKQITRAVVERALQGEMKQHLGYSKGDPGGQNSGNSRNGATRKTLKGDFGNLEISTPRDRNGEFGPQIVKKNQTRWTGFDDNSLSMYGPGTATRD
jgi:putative transposase